MENVTEKQELVQMTKEEAIKFFAEFYRGAHHIPGHVKEHGGGPGWEVTHDRGALSTHDWNELTRLTLMAHRDCYRVTVMPHAKQKLKIAIWKRFGRDGDISLRHPTIEDAIETFGGMNYKEGFDLAMDFINKHPADPDISEEQTEAHVKLQEFLKANEAPKSNE